MRRMKLGLSLVVCLVAACGSSGMNNNGGDDTGGGPDAKVFMDAPPVVAGSITINGKTTEAGLSSTSPVAGTTLTLYASSDQQHALGTATSDANGGYSITVMSSGPIDGYLVASKSGFVDVYFYPVAPFSGNYTDGDINMITPNNMGLLSQFSGGNQMSGKGLIALAVIDASGNPVAGATVSSMPAASAYRYNGNTGIPSSSAAMTSSDGVAFMFNVSGQVMVSASKSGMTFKSHMVEARADKMTTTAVSP
jgi:hypothetical protein